MQFYQNAHAFVGFPYPMNNPKMTLISPLVPRADQGTSAGRGNPNQKMRITTGKITGNVKLIPVQNSTVGNGPLPGII